MSQSPPTHEIVEAVRESPTLLRMYDVSMRAAKEEVLAILEQLPANASLDDVQHHLYIRQKVEHALEESGSGRTLSEEEFDRRMARWLED